MAPERRSGSDFVDIDIVQQHLKASAEYVGTREKEMFLEGNEGALRYVKSLQFDSPLEVLFWVWWNAGVPHGSAYDNFDLKPQQEVYVADRRYRVDFLVEPTRSSITASSIWKPIAVELDGHAFHERTPEQVAIRDSRDRALQAAGWHVFHFSFGEFTKEPLKAIEEVVMFAARQARAVEASL